MCAVPMDPAQFWLALCGACAVLIWLLVWHAHTRPRRAGQTRTLPDLDRIFAGVIVFLIPVTTLSPGGRTSLSAGVILSAALLPLLLGHGPSHYRGSWVLLGLVVAAIASAPLLVWLATNSSAGARDFEDGAALRQVALLGRTAIVLCALLWAHRRLPVRVLVILYATGALVEGLLSPEAWSGNAWKYVFAWPVAVLLLALVDRSRRIIVLPVIAGLALVSQQNDYRSFFGLLLVVALFSMWRPQRQTRSVRAGRKILSGGLALGAVYLLYRASTWLALGGHLGESIQSRTERQFIAGNGSVLAGARPEWGATLHLFQSRPLGFGPGVVPSMGDVQIGRAGLGVAPGSSSTYVDGYLFGQQIELHSVIGDLWVQFGLAGLALAAVLVYRLAGALLRQVASTTERSPMVAFLALTALWDMAFSPILALMTVVLAVAVALPGRTGSPPATMGRLSLPGCASRLRSDQAPSRGQRPLARSILNRSSSWPSL